MMGEETPMEYQKLFWKIVAKNLDTVRLESDERVLSEENKYSLRVRRLEGM